MVANNALVVIKKVLTLPSLGINPQFINFTHVTMESEKYICVTETAPQNSVVIIDMNMPMQLLRLPITADSALMNPTSRILAHKAQLPGTSQDHLQIFNIDMEAKVKSHQMPERVVFWKWITPKMLALVTQSSVYHWSIEGESEPVKMFDRTADLVKNQIINYQCDPSEKLLLLIGFAKGPERPQLVKGNMQLFSVDQQRSQALEAHAASFATFKLPGNENPALLISFASKAFNAGQITSKLHVIELGAQPGKPSFTKKQADLFFPPDFADDFPVSMQISQKYGLIYVITKQGLLFVYDLETASAVYRNRISTDPIFLSTDASTVGGFYAINRRGQVLLAIVNESTVVSFISDQLNNLKIGVNLAKRVDLPRAENPFVQRFPELLSLARHEEAAGSLQGIHHTFGSFPDIQRELEKHVKVREATESPAKEQRKSTEKRAEKRKVCFKYEIFCSVQEFNLYKGYKLVASRCKQKISILKGNYNDFIRQSSLSKLLGGELTLDVLGYDALDYDRGLIILDGEIHDDLNSWYEKILKQFKQHEKKEDSEAIWWNLLEPKLRELRGVFRALLKMYPNNIHGNWMSGIAFIDGQSKLFNMKDNDYLTDQSDFKQLLEILKAILVHRELPNGWKYVDGEQREFTSPEVTDFMKRMSTFRGGRNLKYYFDIPFFWNHEESVNFMLKVYEFIWLQKNGNLVSLVGSSGRFRWQDRVPKNGPLNKVFNAAGKKYNNFMDYVRFWRDCRQHYKDHEEMDSLESLEVELENTFHCCWRIHAALWDFIKWDFINENNGHGRLKEDLIRLIIRLKKDLIKRLGWESVRR